MSSDETCTIERECVCVAHLSLESYKVRDEERKGVHETSIETLDAGGGTGDRCRMMDDGCGSRKEYQWAKPLE